MTEPEESCAVCGRPATRLCDFMLHEERSPGARPIHHTCDLPMCDEHAHREAVWHWHGSQGGGCDTVDKCGYHADKSDAGRGHPLLVEHGRKMAREWALRQTQR